MNKEITYDEMTQMQIDVPSVETNGCIANDIFISIGTLVVVIGIIALFKAVGAKNEK